MKKIINGKKYDTDTATWVGEYWNGLSDKDFRYLSEDLYLKKTGEFFLMGDGGALTIYSNSNGSQSWGVSKIIPLTKKEAREWAEEHLGFDEYVEFFGEPEE